MPSDSEASARDHGEIRIENVGGPNDEVPRGAGDADVAAADHRRKAESKFVTSVVR